MEDDQTKKNFFREVQQFVFAMSLGGLSCFVLLQGPSTYISSLPTVTRKKWSSDMYVALLRPSSNTVKFCLPRKQSKSITVRSRAVLIQHSGSNCSPAEWNIHIVLYLLFFAFLHFTFITPNHSFKVLFCPIISRCSLFIGNIICSGRIRYAFLQHPSRAHFYVSSIWDCIDVYMYM